MKRNKLIGISGGHGAGKTTVSNILKAQISDSILLPHDAYFNSFDDMTLEQKKQINWCQPSAYDNELFLEHLQALKEGRPINKPIYSFDQYKRLEAFEQLSPADKILVEGFLIYALQNPTEIYDELIYLDVPKDERLRRVIQRDMAERGRTEEFARDQFGRLLPMHYKYIEPTKEFATLIIDGMQEPEASANQINQYLDSREKS